MLVVLARAPLDTSNPRSLLLDLGTKTLPGLGGHQTQVGKSERRWFTLVVVRRASWN